MDNERRVNECDLHVWHCEHATNQESQNAAVDERTLDYLPRGKPTPLPDHEPGEAEMLLGCED